MNIINYIKAVAEAITGFNECVNFSQWVTSLRSHSNGTEKQELKEDDVLKLQGSFQCLQDTLPAMYNFIDRVEWRSHEKVVAELLPELKAAVYDAEDLLEDFRCYEQKVKNEGSVTSVELGTKFFQDFIQSNFNTKLTVIKNRLDNQSMMLERMGLHQATLRFDRSIRPETTRFPTEAKIFGRDDETKELIRLLGVPANNSRGPSTRKRPRNDSTNATITSVPVLPIVGIGGVGKTTLAQNICSDPQVRKHFDVIAWVCVSDDFDVKRLTKEAIEQFSGQAPTKDNLNSLQDDLVHSLNNRRFLIVLDDMWAENGDLWKTFYAPFKQVLEGSMILVTTRSQKVADIVRTTNLFLLEGLKDDVFLNFFKLCVFVSNSSNSNLELERIGEQILPKLKGSPLAAKTIGRLLGRSLDPAHWNMILNSELWEHKQEHTEIMPALRLSYIYLPFHLKRCFSFCAVYPKDYSFKKEDLAEIWMAEGFVEAERNVPLQQTACKYFEELAHLLFFQELFRGIYVIHDLMHDMAQLVSKDECFIIKDKKDLRRIPQNVRHLSVLKSSDFECSDLESLCEHTKLRTLLCNMSMEGKIGNNVMEKWCAELLCMRVMVCASISKSGLPNSISNMKNLRYLKISEACLFDSLPATFCHLYNLQLLSAKKCRIEVIPKGFNNLINLQKFESRVLKIDAGLLNNFNLITADLYLCNLCEISKDLATKIELMKKDTFNLTLDWSEEVHLSPGLQVHNEIEVFEALHPPIDIKSVCLVCYPGEYLPSWSHGFNNDATTIFSSLTDIRVTKCPRLSNLEQFLQPGYMPAIKQIEIRNCTSLESIPVEKVPLLAYLNIQDCKELETLNGDCWPSLRELVVSNCPKINSQCLLAPSLGWLWLENSGNLGDDIDCRCLTTFHLSSNHLTSLTFNIEKVPLLTNLTIQDCKELETLNGNCWPSLQALKVSNCPKINSQRLLAPSLEWLCLENSGNLGDDIDCHSLISFQLTRYSLASLTINRGKVPLLIFLTITDCRELDTLNGGWSSLKRLSILRCPRLNLENGIVLPSSLEDLELCECGYFSTRVLENLTSLKSLAMSACEHIEYIPHDMWSSSLKSLEELKIKNCEDLVSIGGQEAIAHIPKVHIETCPKLKEVRQPFRREAINGSWREAINGSRNSEENCSKLFGGTAAKPFSFGE